MSTRELATIPERAIGTMADTRLLELREFVQRELKEGTDYGTIPGTRKPSLWQAGAQKICEYLMVAALFDRPDWIVQDHDAGTYLADVHCRLVHYETQEIIGDSWGSAGRSAAEEVEASNLAAQRRAERDGKEAPAKRLLTMHDKGLARNTTMKMAQKSAMVGAVIGASRLATDFTQDVEDMADSTPAPTAQQETVDFNCPTCAGSLRTGISKTNNQRWYRCDACDKFVNRPRTPRAPRPRAEPKDTTPGDDVLPLTTEEVSLFIQKVESDTGIPPNELGAKAQEKYEKRVDQLTREEANTLYADLWEQAKIETEAAS